MMVVRDDVAQRYYFFLNRKLWKMAVSYNADYVSGIGFEAFVDQVSRKYGDPDETVYDTEGILRRVMWNDARTELRIEDKSEFFGTFIMVFSDRETLKRRGALLTNFDSDSVGKKEVRAAIKEIQEEGTFDVDSDVVDDIVGVDIKVNLERGMPEGNTVRRVGDPAPTNKEALPEEAAKKRKTGRKGRGAAKGGKGGKGKAKGGKAKGGQDELIIY